MKLNVNYNIQLTNSIVVMITQTTFSEETYLVIHVDQIRLAVAASQVLNIGKIPHIKYIPNANVAIPGVIKFRNSIISVIDLRSFLGYPSLQEQIDHMARLLEGRKQDHINWLNELERCVRENDEFTLALDPTQCKLGKWCESFETENKSLQLLLDRFKKPHRVIHNIAEEALNLANEDKIDEGLSLINQVRDRELKTMIDLFTQFDETYHEINDGLVVIVWAGSQTIGFTVDSVSDVQRLTFLEKGEHLNAEVSSALKKYGHNIFSDDEGIIYELVPESISEEVTGIF